MRKKILAFPHVLGGFTLVELMIVMTVLVVLATIALMGYQGFASLSRDASRLSTAKNIESALELYHTKTGLYPALSTGALILVGSLGEIATQGDFDENIARVINLSPVPVDPQTLEPYHYIVNTALTGYKILFYREREKEIALVASSYASLQYANPMTVGVGPGVLLKTSGEMIDASIDLFVAGSGTYFQVIPDSNISLSGNGKSLGGGMAFYAQKAGNLLPPKTCRDGFIPVEGNVNFLQPGFCVAKYEMGFQEDLEISELDDTRNTRTGSTASRSTGTQWIDAEIVSASGKYPIANITQIQAQKACESMGTHLITNHEWMTIARQIENNSKNWSTGQIGNGVLYIGIAHSSNKGCSDKTNTHYQLPKESGAKTGEGNIPINNSTCDVRRQHILSNGEIIWDFSGNVAEHVNGANTTNGELYNTFSPNICGSGASVNSAWYSFHTDAGDNSPQCEYVGEYLKMYYGPNRSFNGGDGIGKVRSYKGTDQNPNRVIIRGGYASLGNEAGIYSISSSNDPLDAKENIGFRCAY